MKSCILGNKPFKLWVSNRSLTHKCGVKFNSLWLKLKRIKISRPWATYVRFSVMSS